MVILVVYLYIKLSHTTVHLLRFCYKLIRMFLSKWLQFMQNLWTLQVLHSWLDCFIFVAIRIEKSIKLSRVWLVGLGIISCHREYQLKLCTTYQKCVWYMWMMRSSSHWWVLYCCINNRKRRVEFRCCWNVSLLWASVVCH